MPPSLSTFFATGFSPWKSNNSQASGHPPEERGPRRPGAAGRTTAGVGEDERRISPPSDQPEDRGRLIQRYRVRPVGVPGIARDLRLSGAAEAEPLAHHLSRQLLETILDRSVDIAERFEQAERNDGGDGGRRGHETSILTGAPA